MNHQIMKTRYTFIALSILAAAISCTKTEQLELQAPQGDLVTITATLPEDVEIKGGGLKTLLSWTWNSGDKLTVIGETTETFNIKPGFTAKKAEFEGPAVKGSKFTILYPGQSALESDWNTQVQNGNDNMDHLKYEASLADVLTMYGERGWRLKFCFTDEMRVERDAEADATINDIVLIFERRI